MEVIDQFFKNEEGRRGTFVINIVTKTTNKVRFVVWNRYEVRSMRQEVR